MYQTSSAIHLPNYQEYFIYRNVVKKLLFPNFYRKLPLPKS